MRERSPARLSYCDWDSVAGLGFMIRFPSVLLLLGMFASFSGCGGDTAVNQRNPTFAGVTLRMSIEKGSPLSEALRLRVPEWEARTGAKVETTEDGVVNPEADVAACSGATLANLS